MPQPQASNGRVKGYEQLTLLTAEFPELFMIRRFDKLSNRILLRLQADLLYLEQELEFIIRRDEENNDELATSYEKLKEAEEANQLVLQSEKFAEAEAKLQKYHETILRMHQIRKLTSPSRRNRSRLWEWIRSPEGGDDFLPNPFEAHPWESAKLSELLTLSPEGDRLDNWSSDAATPIYHWLLGHRRKPDRNVEDGLGRLWVYDSKVLQYLGDLLCVMLSSTVPVVSIQGLYWIPSSLGRLLMISGFIVMFSVILMFVAGCKRSEVFGATSAFAAVLVVFLQGLDGAINCTPSASATR